MPIYGNQRGSQARYYGGDIASEGKVFFSGGEICSKEKKVAIEFLRCVVKIF